MTEKNEHGQLERGLKNRHVQLIAIGGAIGTGLFLGSGKSISVAGPSILLAYLITGIFCFLIMRALGELLLSDLNYHSFVDFVKDYLGDGFAFVTGWTYWLCWMAIAMADLTAVGVYIQYWWPSFPQWAPGLIALVLLVAMNLATVKLFGEMEFWFALIKIVAIIAMIVVGLVLIVMGVKTDTGQASFSHLWDHGGFFPKHLSGFMASFQMAVFAFVGIEIVGQTAGETENPESVIPKAINHIPFRVLIFYILSLIVIMSISPWNTINLNESPFVKVFQTVGIVGAAGIVNFVVLSSAASAANSGVYSTSRMVYSLAKEGSAPKKMARLNKHNVPSSALFMSAGILAIVVLMNLFLPDSVFNIVTSVATVNFLYIWGIIVVCHMLYRMRRPELAAKSKFKMPLYPISNIAILLFFVFIIYVLTMDKDTRISLYFAPVWFLVTIAAYWLNKKFKKKS